MAWSWKPKCPSVLNISWLLVLLLLVTAIMGFCGLDIFMRLFQDRVLLISAGSSVGLLVLGAVLISSARTLSIRSALQSIPKVYVPINPSDLPKRVHKLIQADLSNVANIALEAKPRPQDAFELGWGKQGTALEKVHFKTAAVQTFELLERAAIDISPYLRRPSTLTARRYIEYLISEGVLGPDLGRYYIDRYEQLRFGPHELAESDYREFMKLVAVALRSMKHPEQTGI
ncbi:uncharacterized protein EV422DRAFT_511554 [Fimicolochytrium jonesii]|uniref:uncharacterized protein n=1 Tax=Fimicolochytrium jonesii TaxID=1396493 RepID=UPI0022FE29EC|nr:uncharacterized protein EV422DRAFT_511554 [Fimicolochytrium jonesii]KAI8826823.1 hypothetical protein EV422DRAFT_511554 [Fimicolochytrium jonesii]